MRISRLILWAITGALACTALCAPRAEAGRRVRFTPSLTARTQYDDNVQYLGSGDLETRISPELKLEIDSERTEHTLTLGATRYIYGETTRLDRTNTEARFETEHQATERLTLFGSVGHATDYSLGTSEEELGTVADKVHRDNFTASGRAEYMLTERTQLGMSLGYTSRQYAERYVDYSGPSAGVDLVHAATERLTLRAELNGAAYTSQFQDGGTGHYRSLGGTVGFDYQLTEIYGVFGSIGQQRYVNELDTSGIDTTTYESGLLFEGGLRWEFERSKGRVTYGRDTTSGLDGSTLDRDRLRIYHQYETSERSLLELNGVLTETEADGLLSQSHNRYWSLGLSWGFWITEDSRIKLGVTHRETENLRTDRAKDRNTYWLEYEIAFPEEWTLGGARY